MEDRSALIADFMKLFGGGRYNMPRADLNISATYKETALLFLLKNPSKDELGWKASEIGCEFGIAPSTVTQMINSLEDQGLVERRYDSSDRRAVYIKCTEEGERIEELSRIHKEKYLGELIDYLGTEESKEFMRLLLKVKTFLNGKHQNPCGGKHE